MTIDSRTRYPRPPTSAASSRVVIHDPPSFNRLIDDHLQTTTSTSCCSPTTTSRRLRFGRRDLPHLRHDTQPLSSSSQLVYIVYLATKVAAVEARHDDNFDDPLQPNYDSQDRIKRVPTSSSSTLRHPNVVSPSLSRFQRFLCDQSGGRRASVIFSLKIVQLNSIFDEPLRPNGDAYDHIKRDSTPPSSDNAKYIQ